MLRKAKGHIQSINYGKMVLYDEVLSFQFKTVDHVSSKEHVCCPTYIWASDLDSGGAGSGAQYMGGGEQSVSGGHRPEPPEVLDGQSSAE